MTLGTYRFSDLGSLIDRVHRLFDQWELVAVEHPAIDEDTLSRTKLAVHEWLANLVQHASFKERDPEVIVEVRLNDEGIYCTVEDNSEGFDLDLRVLERGALLGPLPERGMGLLMLTACADDLSYCPHNGTSERNQLSFSIRANDDPWLDIPFQL